MLTGVTAGNLIMPNRLLKKKKALLFLNGSDIILTQHTQYFLSEPNAQTGINVFNRSLKHVNWLERVSK